MDPEVVLYEGDATEETFNETDHSIETELEAIKARVREMEEEAEKIRQIQSEVDKQMNLGSPPGAAAATVPVTLSIEEKIEVDGRSVFVSNVDYGATAKELEQHFHGCGAVNRVTIQCNKFDGHPKGFSYIEFCDKDSVQMAMALDESLFRGRQLRVRPKRTNKPGISSSNRWNPRTMRSRSGSRTRMGGYYGAGGYRPARRPRGRRFHYSPY